MHKQTPFILNLILTSNSQLYSWNGYKNIYSTYDYKERVSSKEKYIEYDILGDKRDFSTWFCLKRFKLASIIVDYNKQESNLIDMTKVKIIGYGYPTYIDELKKGIQLYLDVIPIEIVFWGNKPQRLY